MVLIEVLRTRCNVWWSKDFLRSVKNLNATPTSLPQTLCKTFKESKQTVEESFVVFFF